MQIAFKDFVISKGIWGSSWVGLKYFEKFFSSYYFWDLIKNTLILSTYSLICSFPFPIILALIINYTPFVRLKKMTQTITYMPYFISTVVLVGMMFTFFSQSGAVNIIIKQLGGNGIDFLGSPVIFRHLYVWTGIWQNVGMSSVIYIAILTTVSQELHEAAIVDGANELLRIWHIDIPSILPTAITLLVLSAGNIMNVGFEKTYLMQTSPNLSSSEVISTYVYKIGLMSIQYSYASAIGLFNNVINFIVLIAVNKISKNTTSNGLW